MKDKKKIALKYLAEGYSVIPVGKDKKPLFAWKEFTERKPKKREIEKWWTDNPTAGIAIVTGKVSGITVIDVEHDGEWEYLPETKTVRTGGGGYHFYYNYNPKLKNSVRIRESTDIRNDGGYVVAPPSRHLSGRKYRWKTESVPAEFPEHLFLTEAIKSKKNDWDEIIHGVGKGERNEKAAKVSGLFLVKTPYSLWEHIAWPAVKNWNENNKPPLKDTELRAVFDSIASRVKYRQEDAEKEINRLPELVDKYKKKLAEIASGKNLAVPTGFKLLDSYLNGGWKEGELILIGARPSVGKTSLALTFAENAAKEGKNVLFFSIEMTALDIFEKLMSFVTNLACSDIIKGNVEKETLEKAYKKVLKLSIDIAELSRADSNEVIEVVKKTLLEKKVDLIVVDYLQFLRDKSKANESIRVGKISKNLKTLARMTGIPVVCPAQLNRKAEERTKKEPRMSDLRDSGNLEQDADIVLLLHRDPEGDNRNSAKIIIAKNRKGQTATIHSIFDIRTTKFKEK